jgi:hypothetical protein
LIGGVKSEGSSEDMWIHNNCGQVEGNRKRSTIIALGFVLALLEVIVRCDAETNYCKREGFLSRILTGPVMGEMGHTLFLISERVIVVQIQRTAIFSI